MQHERDEVLTEDEQGLLSTPLKELSQLGRTHAALEAKEKKTRIIRAENERNAP